MNQTNQNNEANFLTRKAKRQLEQLNTEYSNAIEAFSTLTGIGMNDPTLIEQFENCYAGTFNTKEELARHQVEQLGWNQAIQTVITNQAIPEHFLKWDTEAIYDTIATHIYDIVEHDGKLHVFLK